MKRHEKYREEKHNSRCKPKCIGADIKCEWVKHSKQKAETEWIKMKSKYMQSAGDTIDSKSKKDP
jgi:hypothetical protein